MESAKEQLRRVLTSQHGSRICKFCNKRYDTKPIEDWNTGRSSFHISCKFKKVDDNEE